MVTILSITAIIAFLSVAAFQFFKNRRSSGCADQRSVIMPRTLCALALMFSCGMMCAASSPLRLLSDSVMASVCSSSVMLSIRPSGWRRFHVGSVPVIIPLTAAYYLICAAGLLRMPPPSCFLALSGLVPAFYACLYILMIWNRLRDVKSVMKSGNVWSFVTLCVDVVYVTAPLTVMAVLYSLSSVFKDLPHAATLIAALLLVSEALASALRLYFDSAFVFLHDHERLIVESMKISHMEVSSVSDPRSEEQYKELYERIVLYFEMTKPYLDGDLTINDVVKVVFSNKVYISKAICHYTGRNFRQFVNYYRIMYSMEYFRANPELKVTELAERCGFNTVVSYTMAFRLFMNETPSEWCRRERARILKPKK